MNFVLQDARIIPYELPFSRPLMTSRGSFSHRRGLVLELIDGHGRRGFGDAAPWPGFGSNADQPACELAEVGQGKLRGERVETLSDIAQRLRTLGFGPEASYAVELALLDLLGQAQGLSISALLGSSSERWATTHTLVTDGPPPGARHLKLKVGGRSLECDEARLAALREACGPAATIRLDAGGGWSFLEACEAIERFAPHRPRWLEQPLSADCPLDDLARLRRHASEAQIALAVDEGLGDGAQLDALIARDCVDGIVVKPMFCGGLLAARSLIEKAARAGLQAMVTNALESAIGRTGTAHLAAALGGVHGLSNALARDLAPAPAPKDGRVALPPGSGLGVTPDVDSAAAGHSPQLTPETAHSGLNSDIVHPLQSAAVARPDHLAIDFQDHGMTFKELALTAARGAAQLHDDGVRPGMTVALNGQVSLNWFAWYHAIGWLGATVAPLPSRAPTPELARHLTAITPDHQICGDDPISAHRDAHPERSWPLEEARLLVCTSGSTSLPRPIRLTCQQLLLSAFGSAIRLGHLPNDRWLCCLPLHHVAALSIVSRCLFYATTIVLQPRFDPIRVNRAIEEENITLVSLVPAMLERLLDARGEQAFPASLRVILLGGAAPSEQLLRRCKAIDAPVSLTWGMTEAASQVATNAPGQYRVSAPSLAPLSFARVAQDNGRLCVAGPLVRQPLATGDCGTLDDKGWVHVAGRADGVINTGGEKVSPEQLEALLRSHEAIAEVAVVGLSSSAWGQRPAALLVPSGCQQPSSSMMRAWCQERIPNFKVPDHFSWCKSLPRGPLGKVSKALVSQQLRQGIGSGDSGARAPSITQAEPGRSLDKPGRRGSGSKVVQTDEAMHQLHRGRELSIGPNQLKSEGGRTLARVDQPHTDGNPLVHAQRAPEVGFRMNQGHADAILVDHGVDTAPGRHDELFEGGVTKFEETTEKYDPGAVDMKKANGDLVSKRHGNDER